MPSLSLQCLMAAASAYHLSVTDLQAIRTVEGGQAGQEVCQNFDGSCDLGPFQVNDRAWVNTLAARLHADRHKVRDTLRDDGCWNAQVASWILRQELTLDDGDRQAALGDYHSHWRPAHDRYLLKIDRVLQSLSPGDAPPAMPGTVPGESPGAIRIPPDVTGAGAGGGTIAAPDAPQPRGKMIRVGKPQSPGAAPQTDSGASEAGNGAAATDGGGADLSPVEGAPPADAAPPAKASPAPPATPAPHIYRGNGPGG